VADCRDELAGINNRILTAQAKIEKLRSSSTKATKVFSSPKYPAPDKITDYQSIYQNFNPALHKVHIPTYSHIQVTKTILVTD
jgi:WAS family protein 1